MKITTSQGQSCRPCDRNSIPLNTFCFSLLLSLNKNEKLKKMGENFLLPTIFYSSSPYQSTYGKPYVHILYLCPNVIAHCSVCFPFH